MNDDDIRRAVLAHIQTLAGDDSGVDRLRILHPDRLGAERLDRDERARLLAARPDQVTAVDDRDRTLLAVIDDLTVGMRDVTVYGLLRRNGSVTLSATLPGKVCSMCGNDLSLGDSGWTCAICDDGRVLCDRCARQCRRCGRMVCANHRYGGARCVECRFAENPWHDSRKG